MGKTENVDSVHGYRVPGGGYQTGPRSRPGEKMVPSGVGRNSEVREASGVAHSRTW